MELTRTSTLSNIESTLELPITSSELAEGLCRCDGGMPPHQALPELTDAQIEFVLEGVTPEEWERYFDRRNALSRD